MSAQSAQSSTFVIFEITDGCACCAPAPRETVLPAHATDGGLSVSELLAWPHGVPASRIVVVIAEPCDGLTCERVDELRAKV